MNMNARRLTLRDQRTAVIPIIASLLALTAIGVLLLTNPNSLKGFAWIPGVACVSSAAIGFTVLITLWVRDSGNDHPNSL